MTKYQCPVCSKRACDSTKPLSLARLSPKNETEADMIIKCQCCKSTLAVSVISELAIQAAIPQSDPTRSSK